MKQKHPHLNIKKISQLIALVVVLLVTAFLFIGNDSIIHLYYSHLKAKKTEREIKKAQAEVDSLVLESKKLKNDTTYIEKIAREKLGMAGKKEKVFKFIENK
jgi:cell division protein FtsL